MKVPKQTKTIIRIRVPVAMTNDVGLGDAIKHLTAAMGIKPCEGCERRAAFLNRHFVFSGKQPQQR